MRRAIFSGHSGGERSQIERAGLRNGARGTHTSRTMMLAELREVLGHMPAGSTRTSYSEAIIDENLLGKATLATRRLTFQRLSELYGLDPAVPLFRILDRIWRVDVDAQPIVALLCALARDPLLRATADAVLPLTQGEELSRARTLDAIQNVTGSRLNPAVSDKVARNAASSWTQSGHLEGRVRKIRRTIKSGPTAAALALWLGWIEGGRGELLLRTDWARVLDLSPGELLKLGVEAKQMGLIRLRVAGGVVEIDPAELDPIQASKR